MPQQPAPSIPAAVIRPAASNLMTAPISSLTVDELLTRMDASANKPRKLILKKGYEYTPDYLRCETEYRRKRQLADADQELALMEKYAKGKALKKAAAWDECSAVGAGARPEYRSAEEINNGNG